MNCEVLIGHSGVVKLREEGFKEIGSCYDKVISVDNSLVVCYLVNDLAFLTTLWKNLPFYTFVVIESKKPKDSFLSYAKDLSLLYKTVFDNMESARRYRWYMSRKDNLLPKRLSNFWKRLPAFSRYDTYIEDVSRKDTGYEFIVHNDLTSRDKTKEDNYTLISGSLKQEYRTNFIRNTFI